MTFLLRGSFAGCLFKQLLSGSNVERSEEEQQTKSNNAELQHIAPTPDEQGNILVTFDGKDDPENPLHWSFVNKSIATAVLNFYVFGIYVGSSLYTSSQDEIIARIDVSRTKAELGLALYVLGYGAGCLLFSPLSEVPAIGRNPPYIVSGGLFVVLCIPTALVDHYPGLMVLRFLLGFVGSPSLATVPASLADIWGPAVFPIQIALFAAIATLGPSLGPVISAHALPTLGWQFWAWELLIIFGPAYLLMFFLLPETAAPTILYQRAKRLREITGDTRITSESMLKQGHMAVGSTLWFALVKPWEINIKDPAVLFTTVYTGLSYGLVYSFFESLPQVYPPVYNFSPTSTSLVFLTTAPSVGTAFVIQVLYLQRRVLPRLQAGTLGELENFLWSGVLAGPLMPVGLFIFGTCVPFQPYVFTFQYPHQQQPPQLMIVPGWTSRPSIHWIVPTLGITLVMSGVFFTQQSIFLYIPSIYPSYTASIFAANSLARSLFAFAAVLLTRPMLETLSVRGGVSLLAGLTIVCAVGQVVLWKIGKKLRARSRFAV
ncbi:Caffeine resistance protein 5 [Cyphellophora attinorum]|uniref:Caffeine resistance protein 5 n=1 Tax=Cyphellophora attinorum TaxID=1664694 RepID=A0A0N1H457_9EURO|nr:Caffeine resistance protein 5 [Phialophora attinorum]KPI35390.1 Caffeine resistance protein 5 [Phialophora attinorum]